MLRFSQSQAIVFGLLMRMAIVDTLRLASGIVDHEPEVRNVTVFWHISALKGHYSRTERIVSRQWNRLGDSGLLQNAAIKIGFINTGGLNRSELYKNVPTLEKIFQHPHVDVVTEAKHGNECVTTSQLSQFARKFVTQYPAKSQYILYFHSRGVTHGDPPSPEDDWTQAMEYFTIDHWPHAIRKIVAGEALTSGIELWPHAKAMHSDDSEHPGKDMWLYSGSFWWATASYLASLPDPYLTSKNGTNRYACSEDWVLWNWQGKAKHQCLHYTGTEMFVRGRIHSYIDRYPKEFYDCVSEGVPALTPCQPIHHCHGSGCK